jgi:uncharacterized protein (DUF983 family)
MVSRGPELKTVLWRGLCRRCPRCGEGPIYRGWVVLHDRCPKCDLVYLHDQGDLWVYLVIVDRALFIFPLIVMLYFRLHLADQRLFYALAGVLFVVFIYTMPHRNGMALGINYFVRQKWGESNE